MSTKVMNYVRNIDEAIPDLTKEIAFDKTNKIHTNLKNALICAGASMICTAEAVKETTELTTIASKTIVKKAVVYARDVYYDKTATLCVRR